MAQLKLKYKGDKKKCITFDRIKDDILDLRLKQRQASAARGGSVLQAEERERAMSAGKKRKPFRIPAWTKGWVLLPDKEHAQSCAYTHSESSFYGRTICSKSFYSGRICIERRPPNHDFVVWVWLVLSDVLQPSLQPLGHCSQLLPVLS